MQLSIIYEDEYLLAINKPSGLVVERDKWGYESVEESATEYLKRQNPYAVAGIIHRIDRPVSGVLLIAKKRTALKKMNEIFRQKLVEKNYLAITEGSLPAQIGTLEHFLQRDEKNKYALVYHEYIKGRVLCILEFEFIKKSQGLSLIKIKPITGKFHQIRAQLSAINCPIIGDVIYGSKKSYQENAICLHASELSFMHPFHEKQIQIQCNPPEFEPWNYFM